MKEKLCENIQVVVLMGGLGTRLGEQTKNCPKSMIDIFGRPFFEYELNLLKAAGFKKFIFCVGYNAEIIKSYFGDGHLFNIDIQYSYDGNQLRGTGGAVKNALPLLEDNFMLLYGDSFMDINYFAVILKYYNTINKGKKALMTVFHNNNQFDKSNILYKNNQIVAYSKSKNKNMDYIDYGISIFKKEVFEQYNDSFDLNVVYNDLLIKNKLDSHEVFNRFYEIGTPQSLLNFQTYIYNRLFNTHKAVFLDRDGVINEIIWNDNIEQLDSPMCKEDIQLKPNIISALKWLQSNNYLLFIVTNQPAAAKGKTTYLNLWNINMAVIQILKEQNIFITNIEMCPHYPKTLFNTIESYLIQECECRKPKPGMITNLLQKYSIDLNNSWMIGDAYSDIMCGQQAGLNTAFIGNYKCDTCSLLNYNKPNIICNNILDFVNYLKEKEHEFI